MKVREFKPGDKVMLLNGEMRRMKVVDYVISTQKIDRWSYWENPIWEDDVLVECTWLDKLGLPHYEAFSEDDLVLLENQGIKRKLWGTNISDTMSNI